MPFPTADRWILPPEVKIAGDRQRVPYVGAGAWRGEEGCGGRILPPAHALGVYIKNTFSAFVNDIGGYNCRPNTNDTSLTSVHGTGRAIDIMISPIGEYADPRGDIVANWIVQNAQALGVQYLIWNRSQWQASNTTGNKQTQYTGPVPHINHIHAELNPQATVKTTAQFAALPMPSAGNKSMSAIWPILATAAFAGLVYVYDKKNK